MSRLSGLAKKDAGLYEKTINLPFITMEEKFEKTLQELELSQFVSIEAKSCIKKKVEYKNKWAKCIIKYNFTAGISTTSRVESLHSKLRNHLNSNSSLMELFQAFREIEKQVLIILRKNMKGTQGI